MRTSQVPDPAPEFQPLNKGDEARQKNSRCTSFVLRGLNINPRCISASVLGVSALGFVASVAAMIYQSITTANALERYIEQYRNHMVDNNRSCASVEPLDYDYTYDYAAGLGKEIKPCEMLSQLDRQANVTLYAECEKLLQEACEVSKENWTPYIVGFSCMLLCAFSLCTLVSSKKQERTPLLANTDGAPEIDVVTPDTDDEFTASPPCSPSRNPC
jgi:hypothetical protein